MPLLPPDPVLLFPHCFFIFIFPPNYFIGCVRVSISQTTTTSFLPIYPPHSLNAWPPLSSLLSINLRILTLSTLVFSSIKSTITTHTNNRPFTSNCTSLFSSLNSVDSEVTTTMAPSFDQTAHAVCVMDASGHLGFGLVQRLLQRGYTVHASVQEDGNYLAYMAFFFA